MTKIILKYKNVILLSIGILLIIMSFCLITYDKIELIKSNVFDEVELLKYNENNNEKKELVENNEEEIVDDVDTDILDEEKKVTVNVNKKEYIGYLEIKKINLKQGLVSKNSYYNNVNRNIQIIKSSSYPDEENGNTILASHSGTSSISYFKNLYKLEVNDEAKIYYKNNTYTYKLNNIYNVPKTGTVNIKRDIYKTTLTLITCTKGSKTEQTVYIFNLVNKESGTKWNMWYRFQ